LKASCKIAPYAEYDGIRTFTDSAILGFYDRMVDEGTAEVVFSDGEINNRQQFLAAMKYGGNALYIVMLGDEAAGVVWLNRFKSKTCYVHFCAFTKFWGKGSVDMGRCAIKQVLDMRDNAANYCFDTLLGLIPCANVHAIKWLKKVGLREVGVIPNALWNQPLKKSEDGLLLYLTRDILKE